MLFASLRKPKMRKASTRVQTLVGAIGSMLIHGLNKKVLDVSLQ